MKQIFHDANCPAPIGSSELQAPSTSAGVCVVETDQQVMVEMMVKLI